MSHKTDDTIVKAIRAKGTKARRLTRLASFFGFSAILASIVIVGGYGLLIRPKQTKLLSEYAGQGRAGDTSNGFDIERVQWIMIQANSFSIMLVGFSVGVLGLGTLINVAALMNHRNAVSEEVRRSLAEMSESLRKSS
jgi:hypothetical protein